MTISQSSLCVCPRLCWTNAKYILTFDAADVRAAYLSQPWI